MKLPQMIISDFWYDNDTEKNYKDHSGEVATQCQPWFIHQWGERIVLLEEYGHYLS